MRQDRPEGFARVAQSPASIDELDAEFAARAAGKRLQNRGQTIVEPLVTEQENEDLLKDLHDPLGLKEDEIAASPEKMQNQAREEGITHTTTSEIDEATKIRQARYEAILNQGTQPQSWLTAPPRVKERALERDNMFALMRERAHEAGHRRLSKAIRRHAGKLIFGAAFLAAVAAYGQRSDWFPERFLDNKPSASLLEVREVFGPVRDIARAPGLFARHGFARQASGAYLEGALEAEVLYLDRTFAAVTDPEARLAIVSVGIERALTMNDIPALVDWLKRLDWIKNANLDARAAVLREHAYKKLAEVERERGRHAEAQKWLAAANQEAKRKEELGLAIRGKGWTADLADTMRKALESTQELPPPPSSPRDYQRGYIDALNEAAKAFNLLTHVAIGPETPRGARIQ